MKRTQIQLPDELYAQLKMLAAAKEWSLAEALRAGAEYIVRVNPLPDGGGWQPPRPHSLGQLTDEAHPNTLRDLANEPDLA